MEKELNTDLSGRRCGFQSLPQAAKLPVQGKVINLSGAVPKSLPLEGNVINLRNRPVTAHRNTRRS
ncbi:MAG: hypothetical protein IJ089_02680, partial [Clostridia bacterium]|nr:hypothetical protein [Clostridia bacterium]